MNILQLNFLSLFIYGILFLNKYTKQKFKNVFLLILTIQMTLIVGLRSNEIGIDSIRYTRHFLAVSNYDTMQEILDSSSEIGYILLQRIISMFTDRYSVLFMIVAFSSYSILAFFIKKYSSNYFLSYFLFITLGFFHFSFSGMRQTIALAIGFIAFHYAFEKKPKSFLITVIIAMVFHSSAIIILLVYPLLNIKLNNIYIVLASLGYIIVYILRFRIGEFLTIYYYDDRANIMLERFNVSTGLGGLALFIILLLILGFILHPPLTEEENQLFNGTFLTTILSLYLQTLSSFSYLFTRLNLYYFIYLLVFIPMLFNKSKYYLFQNIKINGLLKITLLLSLIIFFSIYYLNGVERNIDLLLPYKFFWD